ncbi:MAG: prepilin peptidase [Methyloprofundus sp.]|nr:prepilin peptidase [Methyloprofundus sp.]
MIAIFIVVLLYASIYDLYKTKIPNFLSAFIVALGFLYNYLLTGNAGLISSFYGLTTGLLATLIFYRFFRLGAGDVKLFAAIGCFVGSQLILVIIGYSYIISALLGIVYLKLWVPWYQNKRQDSFASNAKSTLSQRIPMAPGISMATFYVLYSHSF